MIRDKYGNQVKEGNRVMVRLGLEWVEGIVTHVKEGGTIVPGVAPKGQTAMTGDGMLIEIFFGFPEPPGLNKLSLHRLVLPDKEIVMPVKGLEAS